jgi:putative peptidoglycan lipid II flippase
MSRGIHLILISALTAGSGFLREKYLASELGVGNSSDAYYFAFGLIQSINDLGISSILSVAFLPMLNIPMVHPSNQVPKRISAFLLLTAIWSLLSYFIVKTFSYEIIGYFMGGYNTQEHLDKVLYMQELSLLIPLNSMLIFFIFLFNHFGRFRLPTLSYLVINVSFIAAFYFDHDQAMINKLYVACSAGIVIMLLILAIRSLQLQYIQFVRPDFTVAFFKEFTALSWPIFISFGAGSFSGLLMLSHTLIRGDALSFGDGSTAALGYAFRIYEVPISILINPSASLIAFRSTILHASNKQYKLRILIERTLFYILLIMVPLALFLKFTSTFVVDILLKGGKFNNEAAMLTSEALMAFSPCIFLEALSVVLFKIFFSLHKSSIPVASSFLMIASLIILINFFPVKNIYMLAGYLSLGFFINVIFLIFSLSFIEKKESIVNYRYILFMLILYAFFYGIHECLREYSNLGNGFVSILSISVFTIFYVLLIFLLFKKRIRVLKRIIKKL